MEDVGSKNKLFCNAVFNWVVKLARFGGEVAGVCVKVTFIVSYIMLVDGENGFDSSLDPS